VAELVHLPVDIIVTTGTPATLGPATRTDTIPIVQASGPVDLVREGAATSLARPGGNVTGLATIGDELTAKRLDLLRQTVLGLHRVAVLWNPDSPSTVVSWQETLAAARVAGVGLQSLEVRSPDELDGLVMAASRGQAQVLFPLIDALTLTHRARIADLARANHLPSILDRREYAVDGGLTSYEPNILEQQRRAAVFLDKILKGAKPADLPIERPTNLRLHDQPQHRERSGPNHPAVSLAAGQRGHSANRPGHRTSPCSTPVTRQFRLDRALVRPSHTI
jgi:putative ABC transport system substrate-binding protein